MDEDSIILVIAHCLGVIFITVRFSIIYGDLKNSKGETNKPIKRKTTE